MIISVQSPLLEGEKDGHSTELIPAVVCATLVIFVLL